MVRPGIDDRHARPQQSLDEPRLHLFELVVDQFVIQRTLLRQPPRTEGQPQGNRHPWKNAPPPLFQRDLFSPRGLVKESPEPLAQRALSPRLLSPARSRFG